MRGAVQQNEVSMTSLTPHARCRERHSHPSSKGQKVNHHFSFCRSSILQLMGCQLLNSAFFLFVAFQRTVLLEMMCFSFIVVKEQ